MSNGNLPLTTVEKIAVRLEGDIRQRGLRPGDRYLTAAEASELFSGQLNDNAPCDAITRRARRACSQT